MNALFHNRHPIVMSVGDLRYASMAVAQLDPKASETVIRHLPPPFKPATKDFAARREFIVREASSRPVVRLAGLLAYLSRDNAYNGIDPMLIAGDVHCSSVARLLKFTIDELEQHLMALQRRGLIEPTLTGSLRIMDIAKLEQLADTDELGLVVTYHADIAV